eukprot:TRINITY_DN3279_c8_g2_i1.p1 TRINITY_DN3279_c8_g2~~TRINITY_DN3279_c8_g2_i1.p1  ORF type:complete len:1611 (+),score=438.34 TRINITY_DN3279_c8_g2_i1:27-4835(+)
MKSLLTEYQLKLPQGKASIIATHPTEPIFAVSSTSGHIFIFSDTCELIDDRTISRVLPATTLCWHPSAHILYAGFSEGVVLHYDIATGEQCIESLEHHRRSLKFIGVIEGFEEFFLSIDEKCGFSLFSIDFESDSKALVSHKLMNYLNLKENLSSISLVSFPNLRKFSNDLIFFLICNKREILEIHVKNIDTEHPQSEVRAIFRSETPDIVLFNVYPVANSYDDNEHLIFKNYKYVVIKASHELEHWITQFPVKEEYGAGSPNRNVSKNNDSAKELNVEIELFNSVKTSQRFSKLGYSGDSTRIFYAKDLHPGIFVTCSGENNLKFWNLETEESFTLLFPTNSNSERIINCVARNGSIFFSTTENRVFLFKGYFDERLFHDKQWTLTATEVLKNESPCKTILLKGELLSAMEEKMLIMKEDGTCSVVMENIYKSLIQKVFNNICILRHVEPSKLLICNKFGDISSVLDVEATIIAFCIGEKYLCCTTNQGIKIYSFEVDEFGKFVFTFNRTLDHLVRDVKVYKSYLIAITSDNCLIFQTLEMESLHSYRFNLEHGEALKVVQKGKYFIIPTTRLFFFVFELTDDGFIPKIFLKSPVRSVPIICDLNISGEQFAFLTEENVHICDVSSGSFSLLKIFDYVTKDYRPITLQWDTIESTVLNVELVNDESKKSIVLSFYFHKDHVFLFDKHENSTVYNFLGTSIPYYVFGMSTTTQTSSNISDKLENNITKELMNFFKELEDPSDEKTVKSLIDFCSNIITEDLNKINMVISQNQGKSNLWRTMARICVKIQNFPFLQLCLSHLNNLQPSFVIEHFLPSVSKIKPLNLSSNKVNEANGPNNADLSSKNEVSNSLFNSQPQSDYEMLCLAEIAIHLNMVDDAMNIYEKLGRYDLMVKLYTDLNDFEKALEIAKDKDRIYLKNLYYQTALAKELENDTDAAIVNYSQSNNLAKIKNILNSIGDYEYLETICQDYFGLQEFHAQFIDHFAESPEMPLEHFIRLKNGKMVAKILVETQQFEQLFELIKKTKEIQYRKQMILYFARHLENCDQTIKADQSFSKFHVFEENVNASSKQYAANNLGNDMGIEDRILLAHQIDIDNQRDSNVKQIEIDNVELNRQKALQLYSEGEFYSEALALALKMGNLNLVYSFANMSSDIRLKIYAGKILFDHDDVIRAIKLYFQAGLIERAINLSVAQGQVQLIDDLPLQDIPDNPRLFKKISELFLRRGEPEKSLRIYLKRPEYPLSEILEMIEKYKIVIDNKTLESINQRKDANSEDYIKFGEILEGQKKYSHAAIKYSQGGSQVRALECLIRTNNIDKVVKFAKICKNPEIFEKVADFIKTKNWRGEMKLKKLIISFYIKGKSYLKLARFYFALGESKILDELLYDQGAKAFAECVKILENPKFQIDQSDVGATNLIQRIDFSKQWLIKQIEDIQNFTKYKTALVGYFGNDPVVYMHIKSYFSLDQVDDNMFSPAYPANSSEAAEVVNNLNQILIDDVNLRSNSLNIFTRASTMVQIGDIYAVLIYYYFYRVKDLAKTNLLIQQMKSRQLQLKHFADEGTMNLITRMLDQQNKQQQPVSMQSSLNNVQPNDGFDDILFDDIDELPL